MEKLTQTEINRILALSDAFGPSGLEDEVSALVRRELGGVLELTEDRMRNVRGELNPSCNGPKIMLDAHLDEVGLIVQAVKPNGTMRFLPLGGMAAGNLPSSLFALKAADGHIVNASVAAKPPHFMTAAERNGAPGIDDMVLDCGSVSAEETRDYFGLGIGSFGVPAVKASYDEEKGLIFGKAFDCRIGVAAEIETLRRLKGTGSALPRTGVLRGAGGGRRARRIRQLQGAAAGSDDLLRGLPRRRHLPGALDDPGGAEQGTDAAPL